MAIVDFNTHAWSKKWIRDLSPEAKVVFFYSWTNDHKNLIGMYRIDIDLMAFELGMKSQKVQDTLLILYPKLQYDQSASLLWVVNHVRHQYMRTDKISPKIIEGIKKCLIALKGHHFVADFLETYKILNLFDSDKPYPYPIERVRLYPSSEGKGEGEGISLSFNLNECAEKIIADLNLKSGKNYRVTADVKKLVSGRMKDGFTIEDFLKVNETMSAKWKDNPDMNQYLRPETLYGPKKFQGYLNAKVSLSDRGIVSAKTERTIAAGKKFMEGDNA